MSSRIDGVYSGTLNWNVYRARAQEERKEFTCLPRSNALNSEFRDIVQP